MTLNFPARLVVLVPEALRSHDFIGNYLTLSIINHVLGFHADHPAILIIDPATLDDNSGAFDLES